MNQLNQIKWVLDSFFGQCTVLPDFVLYSGDEFGVDGDEDKGVRRVDCKGLKLGVSATSKISDATLKISQLEWT